jgi:L-fucose isomerase-like protein
MEKIKLKFLSNHTSTTKFLEKITQRVEKLIDPGNYLLTENDPDVLFFFTGGTESIVKGLVSKGRFYLLIGSQHDNSYASATEVKAYLDEENIPSLLLDEDEAVTTTILNNFLVAKNALKRLKGKKLGLIGQISSWLISSKILPKVLKEKLGIDFCEIPWDELPHFAGFRTNAAFLSMFKGNANKDLFKTGQIAELLLHTIESKRLDAITVECFPMVKKEHVTACLPLAMLNNMTIPAGCEGDLTAIAGMMLCKELTGAIPWMANINKVTNKVCMFSHCTIDPGLVSRFSITSHFETGIGTALQGEFKENFVTIFRFDRNLKKAFIASAPVIGKPKYDTACRTQLEVKLQEKDVKLLQTYPLGNHHLIFPGDCKNLLELSCELLCIQKVNV